MSTSFSIRFCYLLALLMLAVGECDGADRASEGLAEAERLRLTGRYAEAREKYQAIAAKLPVAAALGMARCFSEVGENEKADEQLKSTITDHPQAADLYAERASLAFSRGDLVTAEQLAGEAIRLQPAHAVARWIQAESLRTTGKLDEAAKAYQWFVEQPRRDVAAPSKAIIEPVSDLYRGLAMAQHARWQRQSEQFNSLVNDHFPSILQREKNFWPAHLAAALLFAEKYNERDATTELNAALAINPNAAELYAIRAAFALRKFDFDAAQTALKKAESLNPRLILAKQIAADLAFADVRPADAIPLLEAARALNSQDDETLGRLSAAVGAVDGDLENVVSRAGKLASEVVARNPHCGEFFAARAAAFDLLRKYPQAERDYLEARRRMPQLLYVSGELGMVKMRMGDETEAAKLLTEAFAADPFHVRVKNSLEVLDVLQGYAVLETEHFVLRFDRSRDELLARYAARYLEDEVFPEVTGSLGFVPPQKSLFEIFNRAKGASGHSWFSARMVGLPSIGTVGACAGKIVAITSPNDLPQRLNWARVLKHEFVHVVNLQQTDFNIPHWYTEGLAVWHERSPRPPEWNRLLARRLRANQLFHLENINLGFVRPKSGDDWTLAYCQAELYVEYMLATYGPDAPAKMLKGYADHQPTRAALKRCFDVEQEAFEAGYRDFVKKIAEEVAVEEELGGKPFAELEEVVEKNPQDAEAVAQLALAQLQRGKQQEARRMANASLKIRDNQPIAGFVLARLALAAGDNDLALTLLEKHLDRAAPHEGTLSLLATMKLKVGESAAAAELFELGVKQFPHSDKWHKGLTRIALENDDPARLKTSLAALADLDGDNPNYVKKLAAIALEEKDWPNVIRWGTRTVHINVNDGEAHAWLGQGRAVAEQHELAILEFEAAHELEPEEIDWHCDWAQSLIALKRPDEARGVLERFLKQHPGHTKAKQLLESLAP